VAHEIERAPSGRAKCRGCGKPIGKGELRLGERRPNPFGEGEATLWFHLDCGAYKRPEPFLEAAGAATEPIDGLAVLVAEAERSIAHRRLPRIDGAGRAPTGRARCRACREPIEKGAWRIGLVYFEESRFEPSGFVHLGCAPVYFETRDLVSRIAHFSPDLAPGDLDELRGALERG
jgi:hypothetical protein